MKHASNVTEKNGKHLARLVKAPEATQNTVLVNVVPLVRDLSKVALL